MSARKVARERRASIGLFGWWTTKREKSCHILKVSAKVRSEIIAYEGVFYTDFATVLPTSSAECESDAEVPTMKEEMLSALKRNFRRMICEYETEEMDEFEELFDDSELERFLFFVGLLTEQRARLLLRRLRDICT